MIADVLRLELRLAGRQGRPELFRRIYGAWLGLQLCVLCLNYYLSLRFPLVNIVDSYVALFTAQQFLVIMLGVPVFLAGAITEEKTRGILQYLLTTDLSSTSIVVGKLLSGMVVMGRLLLMGLPVICFLGPCGAIDVPQIAALIVATLAPLFAWSAASILISVWSRQTRQAVVTLYILLLLAWLLPGLIQRFMPFFGPLPRNAKPGLLPGTLLLLQDGLRCLDPRFVLEPIWRRTIAGELGPRLLYSSRIWFGLGIGCTLLAIARLRPAFRRQLETPQQRSRWNLFRSRRQVSDADPIRWKEQYIEGLAPLAMLRNIPTIVGAVLVFALVLAFRLIGTWRLRDELTLGLPVLLLATFSVAVRCAATISGERERQTWEALLLTPIDARQLIRGKLHGIIGATFPYLLAYLLASAWLIRSTPMLFAVPLLVVASTLLALRFIGTAGIWCSARSRNTWTSLLGTLAIGYLGGSAIVFFMVPVCMLIILVGNIILLAPVIMLFGTSTPPADAVAMVLTYLLAIGLMVFAFWRCSSEFLLATLRIVARERTPFWKSGVNCDLAVEQYLARYGESTYPALPEER